LTKMVSGASRLFGRIGQRDPRTGACDIGETLNSEGVAFANKQRRAAIPIETAAFHRPIPTENRNRPRVN
jgi:hypothetical protein